MGHAPESAARTIDKAGDFVKENAPGPGQTNIFAGPRAKTADLNKLQIAQRMEDLEFARDDIWSRTGWFRGADGQWRFEIPDDRSRITGELTPTGKPQPMSSQIEHNQLYAAYPELENARFRLQSDDQAKGRYYPKGSPEDLHILQVEAPTPEAARSVGLHEAQHAVQEIEETAPGGAPSMFSPEEIAAERQRIMARYEQEEKRLANKDDPTGWGSVGTYTPDLSDEYIAYQLYTRLAGETEARNVMFRADMSPEERSFTPPWRTQDVHDSQQIIKSRPGEPQRSIVDKTENLAKIGADIRRARVESEDSHRRSDKCDSRL